MDLIVEVRFTDAFFNLVGADQRAFLNALSDTMLNLATAIADTCSCMEVLLLHAVADTLASSISGAKALTHIMPRVSVRISRIRGTPIMGGNGAVLRQVDRSFIPGEYFQSDPWTTNDASDCDKIEDFGGADQPIDINVARWLMLSENVPPRGE